MLAGLIGEDHGEADLLGAGQAGDQLEHVDVGPGRGPGQDAGIDRGRQAARARAGRGPRAGRALRARLVRGRLRPVPRRPGIEDQHVVGQHVGQRRARRIAARRSSPSPPISSSALRRTYTQALARRVDPGTQPQRGGVHGRGCRLEGVGWCCARSCWVSAVARGRGAARVGGVAQGRRAIRGRRGSPAGAGQRPRGRPAANASHLGVDLEDRDAGRGVGSQRRASGPAPTMQTATSAAVQPPLRAISISVWPSGAARGREPSASSGASARCRAGAGAARCR